jgi:hypothetical protein
MNTESNLSTTSIQTNFSKISYGSTFDKLNSIIVEKLITIINRKHDKGSIDSQDIRKFINQQILQLNQSLENLIKWLTNQVEPHYIYLLGILYYYNIGTEENSTKAFELFLKAFKNDYSTAQVYLWKCHNDGHGLGVIKIWHLIGIENLQKMVVLLVLELQKTCQDRYVGIKRQLKMEMHPQKFVLQIVID